MRFLVAVSCSTALNGSRSAPFNTYGRFQWLVQEARQVRSSLQDHLEQLGQMRVGALRHPALHLDLACDTMSANGPGEPRSQHFRDVNGRGRISCDGQLMSRAMSSAASSWRVGPTWLYMPRAIEIVEWPKRSCTTREWMPCSRASVAHVWRRPWRVRRCRP